MKKIIAFFVFLSIANYSFAANKNTTKELATDSSKKNIEDVKTFDFERIFNEANQYYEASQAWKRIKCTPKTSFVCTKRSCEQLTLNESSFLVLDRKIKSIALCKDKLCRYYQAEFNEAGVFSSAKIKESDGIYIRILGDSRYKEISMIGLDSYITNGECVKINDDEKIDSSSSDASK